MNQTHRSIYNEQTQTYVAVSETVKSKGKASKNTVLAAVIFGALISTTAQAAPEGGQVTAGAATINAAGNTTTINQSSQNAAIDWHKFNVGKQETVQFNQPNASSITLNRVTGSEGSAINGAVKANGNVFILNPNGVLIGKDAQINTGGFIASTQNMSNADLMNGNIKLTANGGNGTVNNQGTITVPKGGLVALIAPVVVNGGTINAEQGNVLLASAQAVTITLPNNQLAYTIDQGTLQGLIDNGGAILANGGRVVLTAKGLDTVQKSVINHSGIIEAQTVGNQNGTIILFGDLHNTQLNVSGKLDASAPITGNGGFIETSAAKVSIADSAKISTKSTKGKTGQWLIDPSDFVIGAAGTVHDITGANLSAQLENNDVSIRTSTTNVHRDTSGNLINELGDIHVNDAVTWNSSSNLLLAAHHDINVNQAITSNGGGEVDLASGLSNNGTGTVNFNGAGHVTQTAYQDPNGNTRGTVMISYNPVSYTDAATKSDASGNPYTQHVTLNNGAELRALMLIKDVNQLQAMNTNLSGNYMLNPAAGVSLDNYVENTSYIDASETAQWNGGAGFKPIGDAANPFTGEFNGTGTAIKNLTINRPAEAGGVFGNLSGSVSNTILSNVNIQGEIAGGIAAQLSSGGHIGDSKVVGGTVTAVGSGAPAGGLVGFMDVGSEISDSYATANVKGTDSVGGLVGYSMGDLYNTYATGTVGSTTGMAYATGGLVGANHGFIWRSYATGAVSDNSQNHGGLVGSASADSGSNSIGMAQQSYYDTQTTGQVNSANGDGKTTAEMKDANTYATWTDDDWSVVNGALPLLTYADHLDSVANPAVFISPTPTPTPSPTLIITKQDVGDIFTSLPNMTNILTDEGFFGNLDGIFFNKGDTVPFSDLYGAKISGQGIAYVVGRRLITDDKGLEITFADGSILNIPPNTRISLSAPRDKKSDKETTATWISRSMEYEEVGQQFVKK